MASHLIFNKFLPRSLFGDLISNRILTCIFSNENKHANHLDFNTFLAGIFLNTNIHASHLNFFWSWNSCQLCRLVVLFTEYIKESYQLKVKFYAKESLLKNFMDGWSAFWLKTFQNTNLNLFLKRCSITSIFSIFLKKVFHFKTSSRFSLTRKWEFEWKSWT